VTVLQQRLVVLVVLALAWCALAAPGSASAAVTGCATEQSQTATGDGVVQHVFGAPPINMTVTSTPGNAATATITCTGDTTAPLLGMPLIGPGLSQASGAISVSDRVVDGLTSTYSLYWHPNHAKALADKRIDDRFVFAMTEGSGDTIVSEQVVVNFTAIRQYDLSVDVVAPESVAVAPGGTEATYTATLSNAGPDPVVNRIFYWELTSNVTVLGANPTCGTFNFFPPAQTLTCQAGSIAANAKTTLSLTVRFLPGDKGLTLPATSDVQGSDVYKQASGDLNQDNDYAKKTVSLVAATCPAGTTGTPPNCVTPKPEPKPSVAPSRPPLLVSDAGTKRSDKIFGTSFADRIRGGAGNDVVNGRAGNDVLEGGYGNDRLAGGPGNDKILGGPGADRLLGGAGNDAIACGSGTDITSGGAGADRIRCRDGHGGDVISGGTGRDSCYGDSNDKFISCERIRRS
jgi:hypothetical protein